MITKEMYDTEMEKLTSVFKVDGKYRFSVGKYDPDYCNFMGLAEAAIICDRAISGMLTRIHMKEIPAIKILNKWVTSRDFITNNVDEICNRRKVYAEPGYATIEDTSQLTNIPLSTLRQLAFYEKVIAYKKLGKWFLNVEDVKKHIVR